MNSGQASSVIIFIAFWVIFGAVMFWFYGLTPIVHWLIKSNGDTARAVVLEVRKAGWGWYAGGVYTERRPGYCEGSGRPIVAKVDRSSKRNRGNKPESLLRGNDAEGFLYVGALFRER